MLERTIPQSFREQSKNTMGPISTGPRDCLCIIQCTLHLETESSSALRLPVESMKTLLTTVSDHEAQT